MMLSKFKKFKQDGGKGEYMSEFQKYIYEEDATDDEDFDILSCTVRSCQRRIGCSSLNSSF